MTEIDSLQITIESNSQNAAAAIKGLAGAMELLKKNGSIGVATKNLKSLAEELRGFPDNSQAGRALGRVAGALKQIKEVGSIKGVSNSLSTLGSALRTLDTVKVDSAKFASIASALGTLSKVKAGGINTMMNGLLKIGKATEALNDKAINDFTERVEKLMEKLTPLSAKMTTIQSGFRAINSNARSAGSSIRQMGEDVNVSALNLSSFISIIQAAVSWLQQAIQKFSEFIAEAVEWDGVSARFGRTFGSQAEEVYGWIQRLNEEMGLNVQQFMQYSSLYAQMLTGFGVATEDARNMAVGYTELTYDIWASANDRYKTFQEAADAVASAIAGEVEPIRRAGFTIVESTLAETAAYHGLDISIESATESQKSYLRYLALVDQAHSTGTIGVYAEELDTAEGMMRTFSQQLKSLAQAFGSLFIPVLVKVMPYLQAFVELLAEGVRWIAGLFGIEIQAVDFSGYTDGADAIGGVADSANGATDALKDTTKAAKELKNATLGIDELNVISPQSATGGSGGGGGSEGGAGGGVGNLDIGSLWDESIFDNIQSEVDSIKEKMSGWLPVIGAIAAGFVGLRLAKLVTDVVDIAKGLKDVLGLTAAGGGLAGAFNWMKEYFAAAKQMAPEVGWMAALFPQLSGWFASIGTAISGAATAVGAFLAGISAPVWATIAAVIVAIGSAAYFLYENWEAVKRAVKGFFDESIAPKLDSIRESWEKMKDAIVDILPPGVIEWFKDVGKWIMEAAAAVKEWFTSIDWLKSIGVVFEWLGGIVFSIVGGVIATTFSSVVQIIAGLIETFSGVVQVISGFVEFWIAVFTGGDLMKPLEKMFDGIKDIFSGLYEMTIGVVVDWVESIISWFTNLWDELVGHSIVPDTIDGIVEYFKDMPGRVFAAIGDFFKDLLDDFKGFWKDVVSWWEGKKGLKDYVPNIGSIKAKLISAWESAKEWWDDKKAILKTYTPSIGSIKNNLSSAWSAAQTWWDSKKAALKTYTPSIGSIKNNLSSAWSAAQTWWNSKKKAMKTYTPSIGSIKDELKDAWTTAKDWFNKQSLKLNIKMPHITVSWDYDIPAWQKTVADFLFDKKALPKLDVKWYAAGGFPAEGEFFVANEAGPEMVGRIGNRSAVVNNDQIVEAVSEGVYAAVAAAMRTAGGNGTQAVNVYLDGRQIYSSVKKTEAERGATLMGNQLGYTY